MRIKLLVFLLLVVSLLCCFVESGFSITEVQIEQGFGFLNVATPTMILATTTPVIINELPKGTKNIYITAFNGDVLVGSKDNLATGAVWVAAAKIASGTTIKIDGIFTTKPQIYFLSANAPSPVIITIAAWGTQ